MLKRRGDPAHQRVDVTKAVQETCQNIPFDGTTTVLGRVLQALYLSGILTAADVLSILPGYELAPKR
jgi:hypothetical protein